MKRKLLKNRLIKLSIFEEFEINGKTSYNKYVSKETRIMFGKKDGVFKMRNKQISKKSVDDSLLLSYDIYDMTGLYEEMFIKLFDQIKGKMKRGYKLETKEKSHKLSKMMRFLLVLTWLRLYPKYSAITDKFPVSASTVNREVNYLIPILVEHLNIVQWPKFAKCWIG